LPTARAHFAATVVVWVAVAACLTAVALSASSQYDFRVYYAAARTLTTHANPYAPWHSDPGWPAGFPFLYPPVTLYAFYPFTALPIQVAVAAWLGLKLLAVALLLAIWHRHFEPLNGSWLLTLFLTLAFNAALLRDLTTGNAAIFEQLGIWFALSLLVRDRPYAAGLALAAAAQLKLMPIALAGLLLFVGRRSGYRPLLASVGCFVGLFSLNFLLAPDLTHQYLEALINGTPHPPERAMFNPSSLALIGDITDAAAKAGLPTTSSLTYLGYAAFLIVVALAAWRTAGKNVTALKAAEPRVVAYLGCVLFVLTMPRVKDYTYVILLMPALFVVRQIMLGRLGPGLFVPLLGVLIFYQPRSSYVPGLTYVVWALQAYLPWLVAWIIMVYLVRSVRCARPEGAPQALETVSSAAPQI
jgi:hypothetical protein